LAFGVLVLSAMLRYAALLFAVLRIWAAFGLELALMLAWNYQVNHDLV